jgi:hypothetical protein
MGIYTVTGKNIWIQITIKYVFRRKIMDPFVLVLVVIGFGLLAIWYFNRDTKNFDTTKDGQVNFDDAKKAVENTVEGVKSFADVNKDGKVDVSDAKEAVAQTATKAKRTVKKAATKVATKAKTAVKKPRTPKLKVAK